MFPKGIQEIHPEDIQHHIYFICDARIPSRCGFVGAFFASKLLGFDTAAPGLGRLTTWQRPVDFRKVARSTGFSAWAADGPPGNEHISPIKALLKMTFPVPGGTC